ncbi:hypothetical protein AALO_G00254370 [Alosa alosa]|uniref:Uncharacterized protein n=1 Tax=Alosa alosa TaxID=278164 RepID=A0AAV6FTD6_9TELE|nr:hypothetical protein AALO_G00254370 [Alosa alosa]
MKLRSFILRGRDYKGGSKLMCDPPLPRPPTSVPSGNPEMQHSVATSRNPRSLANARRHLEDSKVRDIIT